MHGFAVITYQTSIPSAWIKNQAAVGCLIFWQRYKDSNLNKQSQSLSCYRYTIPLCFGDEIYYTPKSTFVKR